MARTGISWNCRGCVKYSKLRALKDLVSSHHPDWIFTSEIVASAEHMEFVQRNLGYQYSQVMEPYGKSVVFVYYGIHKLISLSYLILDIE